MGAAVSSPSPPGAASPPVATSPPVSPASSVPSLSSPVSSLSSPYWSRPLLPSVPVTPRLLPLPPTPSPSVAPVSPVSPPVPSPFTPLPLSIVCAIIAFASDDPIDDDVTKASNATASLASDAHATTLHTLAQVSRACPADARSIRRSDQLRGVKIDANTLRNAVVSRPAQLCLRTQLVLQRATLRELSIEVGGTLTISREVWDAVLANAPLLDTLSIRPTHTPHSLLPDAVLPLLGAAARHCPNVQSLLLSNIRAVFGPRPSTEAIYVPQLVQALERGFQNWHGLRELMLLIPFQYAPDNARWATQYVEALARHGHHLERVGGYREANDDIIPRHAEKCSISLATWARFCASSSQLTTFDWAPVPLATAFFETFGRFLKPQLTSLVLRCSGEWDWNEYCRQYPELTVGFGPTAENPQAVFAACPALRQLHVVAPYLSDDYPQFQWMYVRDDLFGDAFCEALVRHCRELEHFEISSELGTSEMVPIATFTDAALLALATLPHLSRVRLQTVNISGHGLFALVVASAWSHEWRIQREFSMAVGGNRSLYAMQFFDVVKQFLTRLAAVSRRSLLAWNSTRMLLRLHNSNVGVLQDRVWTRQYFADLVRLIHTVQRKCPQLRLRVVLVNARYGGWYGPKLVGFGSIEEFALYTVDATLPPHDDWARGPLRESLPMRTDYRRIDDVFVKRGDDLVVRSEGKNDAYDDDISPPPSESEDSAHDGDLCPHCFGPCLCVYDDDISPPSSESDGSAREGDISPPFDSDTSDSDTSARTQ